MKHNFSFVELRKFLGFFFPRENVKYNAISIIDGTGKVQRNQLNDRKGKNVYSSIYTNLFQKEKEINKSYCSKDYYSWEFLKAVLNHVFQDKCNMIFQEKVLNFHPWQRMKIGAILVLM